jgi:hypothetical protein
MSDDGKNDEAADTRVLRSTSLPPTRGISAEDLALMVWGTEGGAPPAQDEDEPLENGSNGATTQSTAPSPPELLADGSDPLLDFLCVWEGEGGATEGK